MTRVVIGPFNRVEGDLEVALELRDGRVDQARVNAPMFRGFETILPGRHPLDALAVVPRICGICSLSQSVAAATALADLMGMAPARNGRLAINLAAAAENLADHLSHFYLFFMPDFARDAYAGRSWFAAARARFAAGAGAGPAAFMPFRNRLLHVVGIIAGKWPHSLAVQPGGTTRAIDKAERIRLLTVIADARAFLERETFAVPLDDVAAVADPAGFARLGGDAGRFAEIAGDLALDRLGRIPARLLAFGAYPDPDRGEAPSFPAGIWTPSGVAALHTDTIAEDCSHAWLEGPPRHPAMGETVPAAAKPGGYSWCKAARLDGAPAEVGALARQALAGQPLARAVLADGHSHVFARVAARLVEAARLVGLMEDWARALDPAAPFMASARPAPKSGRGAGLIEAARGALGHWLEVEDGRIARYQIVAPTGWNFSPRDAGGMPGPVEAALVGTPVEPGPAVPVAVQHVVRSFDPCMVCTVH